MKMWEDAKDRKLSRRSRKSIPYFIAAAALFFLAFLNYEARNSLFTYAFGGLGLLALFQGLTT
jgi:hypothetical protein